MKRLAAGNEHSRVLVDYILGRLQETRARLFEATALLVKTEDMIRKCREASEESGGTPIRKRSRK